MSKVAATRTRVRIQGLDGLRAIAATLVLLYHLLPGTGRIGFIGVDIFFVISGFLITALLMKEWDSTASINIRAFWMRRFRRLIPAVAVTVVCSLALARIVSGDALVQTPWQTFGALTGTYNWLEITNGSSYFNSQTPLLLGNMWSLSLEQQFYLLWPPIILASMFYLGTKGRIALAASLGGASVVLHVLFLTEDVTRSYVGTDTHIFGLTIGAVIALSLPGIMHKNSGKASSLWGLGAWGALAVLIVAGTFLPSGPFMYPWGLLLASLLTAVVVRGILPDVEGAPSHFLASTLDARPLVWLGERSYGIYLWHWPLWVLFSLATSWRAPHIALSVVIISVVLAHLSYRYVETPIRVQGLRPYIHSLVSRRGALGVKIAATFSALILALAGASIFTSRDMSSAEELVLRGQKALDQQKADSSPSEKTTDSTSDDDTSSSSQSEEKNSPATKDEENESSQGQGNTSKDDGKSVGEQSSNAEKNSDGNSSSAQEGASASSPVTGDQVTIIGDSVTVAASPALLENLPGAVIDAKVSRLPSDFAAIAQAHAKAGSLRKYVVVSLATNGLITDSTVEKILAAVGPDTKIVLVTAFGPERAHWIPDSNAAIYANAQRYPDRIRVADWGAYASSHQDLLASDRVHPNPEAAATYSTLVVGALNSF